MRQLTDHVVEGDAAPQLRILVLDEPGAGGASHEYEICWGDEVVGQRVQISFQNGPIKENGINGVTQEAWLAIVIDRLRSFQAGPFPSPFNESALRHCELALGDLQQRTRNRIARGVEGRTEK